MQYNFKKFQNTHGRYEGRITITASNSIGFPTKFFKENNIANYKYVVLYFDEQERALGIQFSNSDEEQHKFSLIKSNQGYGGSTVATSFFKKYEIDTKIHKGKYDWEKIETEFGKLFVIKLKKNKNDESALVEHGT